MVVARKLGTVPLVIALVLLGGVVIVGGGFAWFAAIRPRLIMHRFDECFARHPVGSPIADLVDDRFVDDLSMASVGGKSFSFPDRSGIAALRAEAKSVADGKVWLEWTYLPPFGRLSIDADFSGGRITSIKQSSLD